MGPRRVGKTVLIHHSIAQLLGEGVPPGNICYVSVDNPIYLHRSLDELLVLFGIATKDIVDPLQPKYVFFDEIQYLRDWERHLKSLVDHERNVKFVVSGSAAAALRIKSDESGAGRFTDFLLPPLTFFEYLHLLGRGDLVEVDEDDGTTWFSAPEIEELNQEFVRYLNLGGYPEVAFSAEIQKDPARFIKSDIVDKVLLRDLPSLYGISNIQELNSLFTSLAFNTAQEISLDDLAQNSGVAKPTIKRYVEYLEAAFLVRAVRRVDERARNFKRQRNFKVHLTNPSMRTALFGNVTDRDLHMGAVVETGVFSQFLHSPDRSLLHYARWKKGEIDILRLGIDQKPTLAVEVKWTDRPAKRPKELEQAIGFCQDHNLPRLIVTSKTATDNTRIGNVELDFWPASMYAYSVGHAIITDQLRSSQKQAVRPVS